MCSEDDFAFFGVVAFEHLMKILIREPVAEVLYHQHRFGLVWIFAGQGECPEASDLIIKVVHAAQWGCNVGPPPKNPKLTLQQ